MRGRSADRDRRAGRPTSRNGRRSPTPLRARSISRSAPKRQPQSRRQSVRRVLWVHWRYPGSRSDDDLPSASIADQVAAIARKNLAPQAAAIDEGTVYPDALLRRLGDVGAWGSHQPDEWRGRPALRHSIDRGARRSLRRYRLHGVVPEHAGLVRGQFGQSEARREIRRQVRNRENSRRHRSVQSDEELLRDREAETEGPQGRGRLHRQGRAALGLQSRSRPFLRHYLRARGRARRS